MKNTGLWRSGAVATAIALLGGLVSLDAQALALGRITVQSALGEPLRAEIDFADITADEAASLRAGVASPDAFKAAGLEYTAIMSSMQVSLQRRANGQAFLRLSSNRPVTEPFVDLILEANWASGRLSRDYTMLFDPPGMRSGGATAVTPTAPLLSRPAAPAARPPAASAAPDRAPAARAPQPTPSAAPADRRSATQAPAGDRQVTVKPGETAGAIASRNKPDGVSLDQMLVALLRSNPQAFIGDNVNRVKAGAVLEMPSAEAASAIAPEEASRTIVAQSQDFNNFRRKLAQNVSETDVAGADRQAAGKLQANVQDRAPASATPDKLTLSKGAVQGRPAAEDSIAKDRQARDAATRVAELSKNINDLNKLGTAPAAGAPPAAGVNTPPAPALPLPLGMTSPGAAVPAPGAVPPASPAVVASAPAAVASAPEAASAAETPLVPASLAASEPAAPASAAPAPVVAAKPAVTTPPVPEASLLDDLLGNPLLLPLVGGLLVLLAGFGFYRYRQRGGTGAVDSSFLESRLQPDSFFGASGGQRIDTTEGNATGSSLVYSPSQLDAAGDVDPVAEADVYLAYGRDLQAEEILKEAIRTSPTRVAIHSKLMEIYAKRRDTKAFEMVAIEAFNLTQGNGSEWAYMTEMGRELDPSNPMYQPGGQPRGAERLAPPGAAMGAAAALGAAGATAAMAAAPAIKPAPAPAAASAVDVDLDLDFSLDDVPLEPAAAAAPTAPQRPLPATAAAPAPAPDLNDLGMDFDNASFSLPPLSSAAPPAASATAPAAAPLSNGLDFTPASLSAAPVPAKAAPAPAPAAIDAGMLEFDLGSLSLDLNGPSSDEPITESPAQQAAAASSDPLETKFLLAEEFRALGDSDGARSLAEEVLADATGPLKVKAQAFLNALS